MPFKDKQKQREYSRKQYLKKQALLKQERPCTKCGEIIPATDRATHVWGWCKNCVNAWQRNRFKENPQVREKKRESARKSWAVNNGKYKEKSKFAAIKRIYGLAREDYIRMLNEQSGACKLCGTTTPNGGKDWCVDHDHDTGRIRGLLCHVCNTHIGIFEKLLDKYGLNEILQYLGQDSFCGIGECDVKVLPRRNRDGKYRAQYRV